MLAIGRALMARPRLLLLDEPSLGIAPLLVQTIFEAIARDQPRRAPPSCWSSRTPTRPCATPTGPTCWRPARIVMEGPSSEVVAANPRVKEAYLGE